MFLSFKYDFFLSQAGEANGNSNLEPGVADDLSKKQKQLEELTEKLENAQRDRKSTRLNSSHVRTSRMPSSA